MFKNLTPGQALICVILLFVFAGMVVSFLKGVVVFLLGIIAVIAILAILIPNKYVQVKRK